MLSLRRRAGPAGMENPSAIEQFDPIESLRFGKLHLPCTRVVRIVQHTSSDCWKYFL